MTTHKRKLSSKTENPSSEPSPKCVRKDYPLRAGTPTWFWDNLSHLDLYPRALQEFDRRTSSRPEPPRPPRSNSRAYRSTELKRFARHGGPNLDGLRRYPEPHSRQSSRKMSGSQSNLRRRRSSNAHSESERKRTKRTSAYDPGFEQHLVDHGIRINERKQRPGNWQEINQRLKQPRPSLSPSKFTENAFENFQQKNDEARSEMSVMGKPFRIIIGDSDIPSEQNIPFGNLADLTDGSITKATPDFYDGARPADIDLGIRKELESQIMPSTNKGAPCLPNFFAEGKGPAGNAAVCKRQACYDGALGARAMHSLRSHIDSETALDNNAYTITSTYHGGSGGGQLKLYTSHPCATNTASNPIEYCMVQLDGWDMTGNPNTFRQGARALRNARDWAKEQREALQTATAERMPDRDTSISESPIQQFTSVSTTTIQQDTDTSADEPHAEGYTTYKLSHV